MGLKSDSGPAATAMAADQATRLRRLRRLVTAWQVEAAEAAGVSKDSWSRMELGQARVDAVALGRFALRYGVPAEYVVTGRLHGFPDDMLRRVTLAEAEAEPLPPPPPADAAPERSAARKAPAPAGSPPQRSTRRKPAMA